MEEITNKYFDKSVKKTEELKEYKPLNFSEKEKCEIAEKNMRLIGYTAKKFNNCGISYDELVSIGQIGFAKALMSFDKNRKVSFSTFCINCIRNEILLNLRKEKKHMNNNVSLNKTLSTDKNGNELELEEILNFDDNSGCKSLEENVIADDDKKILMKALSDLKEKEKTVLIYRFGLLGKEKLTQNDIANMIGMSQANVSKIEKLALKKAKKQLRKHNYVHSI